jgi:hypothetical protein
LWNQLQGLTLFLAATFLSGGPDLHAGRERSLNVRTPTRVVKKLIRIEISTS